MKKHKALTINFDKIVFDITTELSIGNQNSVSKKFMTVWDTGAQGSVITKRVKRWRNEYFARPCGFRSNKHKNLKSQYKDKINEFIS